MPVVKQSGGMPVVPRKEGNGEGAKTKKSSAVLEGAKRQMEGSLELLRRRRQNDKAIRAVVLGGTGKVGERENVRLFYRFYSRPTYPKPNPPRLLVE